MDLGLHGRIGVTVHILVAPGYVIDGEDVMNQSLSLVEEPAVVTTMMRSNAILYHVP